MLSTRSSHAGGPALRWLLFATVVAGLVGCGPSTGSLSGRVTYKNKALPFGWVKLQAGNGQFFDAKIETDGAYTFASVPVGDAKFTVACVDPKLETYTRQLADQQKSRGNTKSTKIPVLPARTRSRSFTSFRAYEDITRSKLAFKVEPGPNVYHIDLK